MLYVERELKGYAVTESELRQLGHFNRIAGLFFSIGTGAVGFGLAIAWDLATAPTDAVAHSLGRNLLWFIGGFALMAYAIGSYMAYTRSSEITAILGQSSPKG